MENSDLSHAAAGRLPTKAHGLDAKMSVFRREQRDQVWQALWPRQAVGEVLAQNVVPDTQLWLGLFCSLAIISYMPDLTNHVHLQIKNRVLNKSSLSGSFFFHLSERNNPKLFIYWPGN